MKLTIEVELISKSLIRKKLILASKWLKQFKWCQGKNREYIGREDRVVACCIYGVVGLVCEYRPELIEAVCAAVRNVLKGDISHWNDVNGRTKEEVISILEIAAKGVV